MADVLTQDTWNQAIKNLVQPNYTAIERDIYQQASTSGNINPNQGAIPFPGTWHGPDNVDQIISPYVDWDNNVWVVSKVNGEGDAYIWSVFSSELQATKFTEKYECQEYEYWDITSYELDGEVVHETKE